ncbi:hypothetical protein P4V86_03425 [Brevibacillus laterosporus]|uniref:hypothetical protein n=1 Tax=Brevibacillus laterosporus TaxID=1465 RepID=UPI00035E475E|nr:hypothetical protein [Brevibacillus laterosporus]ATO48573.1 hypothetical protein BrL25_05255 [Brevibacillus laterosporus DSM 25]MED2002409.1 hypothetical protein [Brevibacillus laterosporus]
MGVARLVESGRIYEDNFTNSTLDPKWEVLLNDPTRYEVSGGNLVLKHGASTLYMFLKPLTDEKQFVMDVKNSYNPDTGGCYGGIVVFIDEHNYMEIEEFLDASLPEPLLKTYPWIRLVRDYNYYTAYWSEDGFTWNIIGLVELGGAPKIGLYLRGDGDHPMTVEYIRVNKGTSVTVDNLTKGTVVDLIDSNGVVLESRVCRSEETSVSFDMDKYPYPFLGNFGVGLTDGNRYQAMDTVKLYKGDLLYFEVTPDLYYKESNPETDGYFDILLYPNTDRFLGYLTAGGAATQEVQMFAKNPMMMGDFKDVTFALTAGTNKVQIAPDVGGVPGSYSYSITAFKIAPGESYKFWLRMAREESQDRYTSQVKFSLKMYSTYL